MISYERYWKELRKLVLIAGKIDTTHLNLSLDKLQNQLYWPRMCTHTRTMPPVLSRSQCYTQLRKDKNIQLKQGQQN